MLCIGNHFIEYGAQWIHGVKKNPIYQLASNLDLVDKTNGKNGKGNLAANPVLNNTNAQTVNIPEVPSKEDFVVVVEYCG